MLIITSFLEQQAIEAGETFDSTQRNVISVLIFIANMLVVGLPVLRSLAAGGITGKATRALTRCVGKDKSQGESEDSDGVRPDSDVEPQPGPGAEPGTISQPQVVGEGTFMQVACWIGSESVTAASIFLFQT